MTLLMSKISKILSADSVEDVLHLTNTNDLDNAEKVTLEMSKQELRSMRSIIFRILFSLFLILITLALPLLILITLPALYFINVSNKKYIHKKFSEFRSLEKGLHGHPENTIRKDIVMLNPQSVILSKGATISDDSQYFYNSDEAKHLWKQAGYCRVHTGGSKNDGDTWQWYYVFVYTFQGNLPHTILVHPSDRFRASEIQDVDTLANICPPWKFVSKKEYEIETLAIFSPDLIHELSELSAKNKACTIEFFNDKLYCFIPSQNVSLENILEQAETANLFARTLLQKLSGSVTTPIGDISLLMERLTPLNDEQKPELTAKEKKQEVRSQVLMLLAAAVYLLLFSIIIFTSSDKEPPSAFLFLLPIFFTIIIFLLMTKRARKEYKDGGGMWSWWMK